MGACGRGKSIALSLAYFVSTMLPSLVMSRALFLKHGIKNSALDGIRVLVMPLMRRRARQ